MPKLKMRRADYDAGLDRIWAKFEREYGDSVYSRPDVAAAMNGAIENFKQDAVITETSSPRPAPSKRSRRGGKLVTGPAAAKAASTGSSPSARPTTQPGAAIPAPKPPSADLKSLDSDALAAMTREQLAAEAKSPFWRPTRESGPLSSTVTETVLAPAPLHQLSTDDLHDHARNVFAEHARSAGLVSPVWAG
jgi:hypothetical protein